MYPTGNPPSRYPPQNPPQSGYYPYHGYYPSHGYYPPTPGYYPCPGPGYYPYQPSQPASSWTMPSDGSQVQAGQGVMWKKEGETVNPAAVSKEMGIKNEMSKVKEAELLAKDVKKRKKKGEKFFCWACNRGFIERRNWADHACQQRPAYSVAPLADERKKMEAKAETMANIVLMQKTFIKDDKVCINETLQEAIKKREALLKQALTSTSPDDWLKFREQCKEVEALQKKADNLSGKVQDVQEKATDKPVVNEELKIEIGKTEELLQQALRTMASEDWAKFKEQCQKVEMGQKKPEPAKEEVPHSEKVVVSNESINEDLKNALTKKQELLQLALKTMSKDDWLKFRTQCQVVELLQDKADKFSKSVPIKEEKNWNPVPEMKKTNPIPEEIKEELKKEIQLREELLQQALKSTMPVDWAKFREQAQKVELLESKADCVQPYVPVNEPAVEANVVVSEFFCDACDMVLKDEEKCRAHFAQHQTCGINGCKIAGLAFANGIHVQMQHKTQFARQIMLLDSPTELSKWLDERNKKFPRLTGSRRRMAQEAARKLSSREGDARISSHGKIQIDKYDKNDFREDEKKSKLEAIISERISRSPRRHSRSPRRHSRSPHLRSRSPHLRSRSPHLRSRSPHLHSRSPHLRSRSPHLRSRSPHLRSGSPKSRELECKPTNTNLPKMHKEEGNPAVLAVSTNPKHETSTKEVPFATPKENELLLGDTAGDGKGHSNKSRMPDILDIIASQTEETTQAEPVRGMMQSVAALKALKQIGTSGNSKLEALRKQLFTEFVKEEFGDSFAEKLKRALDNNSDSSNPQDDTRSEEEVRPLQILSREEFTPNFDNYGDSRIKDNDRMNQLLNMVENKHNVDLGQQLSSGREILSRGNAGLLEQLGLASPHNIIPEPKPPKQDNIISKLMNLLDKTKVQRAQPTASNRETLSQNDVELLKYYERFAPLRDNCTESNSVLSQDNLLSKLLNLGAVQQNVQAPPQHVASRETWAHADAGLLQQRERFAPQCDSVPHSQDSVLNKLLDIINSKQTVKPAQQFVSDREKLSHVGDAHLPLYREGCVSDSEYFPEAGYLLKQGNLLNKFRNSGCSNRNVNMAELASSEQDILSDTLGQQREGMATCVVDVPSTGVSSTPSRLLGTLDSTQKAQIAQQLASIASVTGRTEVSEDLLSYLILQASKSKEKSQDSLDARFPQIENPASIYQASSSEQTHLGISDLQTRSSRQQHGLATASCSRRERYGSPVGSPVHKQGLGQNPEDAYEDWLNTQLVDAKKKISSQQSSASKSCSQSIDRSSKTSLSANVPSSRNQLEASQYLANADTSHFPDYQDASQYSINQDNSQYLSYQDSAEYSAYHTASQYSVYEDGSTYSRR